MITKLQGQFVNSGLDKDGYDRFGRFCGLYHIVWISVIIHSFFLPESAIMPLAFHGLILGFLCPVFAHLIRDDTKWKEFTKNKNEDEYVTWKHEVEDIIQKL
jgi:hypothetical protein